MYSEYLDIVTKKYLIDVLNIFFFADVVVFDDKSQFNELYSMNIEEIDDNTILDQRGALFVHSVYQKGFRVLISCIREKLPGPSLREVEYYIKSVCYRITNINQDIVLEYPTKVIKPFDNLKIDYSIAHINFGVKEDSSYSMCDNIGYVVNPSSRLKNLLVFILNSNLVGYQNIEVFQDLLKDSLSIPPDMDSQHYSSIY